MKNKIEIDWEKSCDLAERNNFILSEKIKIIGTASILLGLSVIILNIGLLLSV